MPSRGERTKLIVGIDYGTTYSGISFAMSNAADFKDIHPWTRYPGAASHSAEFSVKAPTRVAFQDENPEIDENAWGYQIEPGMKIYAWTKLLLDKDALGSEFDDPELYLGSGSELMQLTSGKSAKEVAVEYLRGMRKMFENGFSEFVGGSDQLETLPVDFWITVPASWSEKAKLLTKAAALEAGFGTRPIDRIMLIPEPEAAAHLALKSSLHHLEDFVKLNTGVLVCDCGGGTVDITTYEIERKEPTLQLREIAVGVAGKCGGTFIDRNLFRLLASRFGEAFTSLGVEQIGPGSSFMDQFEMKKRDFSMKSPSRRAHRISLPMTLPPTPDLEKYYEKRSSSVLLTQADYQSLFDPVIGMVIDLISNQVQQLEGKDETHIETIVLVGGFGSSPYLKERLIQWCEEKNIRLTTPMSGAWSAVVCGAVLRGLEGSLVTQKRCRRHYGHALSRDYQPELHKNYNKKERYLWTNVFDKTTNLTGFMTWHTAKGDVIDETTEVKSDFFKYCTDYVTSCGEHTLYSCSLDKAPETIEHERVEVVGRVFYSLGNVDLSDLRQQSDDNGKTKYLLPLTLSMRLDDEVGHLVFRILYKGKEVGKAGIDLGSS